jgi:hypothetical protein
MATEKTTPIPIATPENTPVPGGGSWRWGLLPPGQYGLLTPGWVENPPYGEDAAPIACDPPLIPQDNLE